MVGPGLAPGLELEARPVEVALEAAVPVSAVVQPVVPEAEPPLQALVVAPVVHRPGRGLRLRHHLSLIHI